jgi:hypothetical protein
MKKTLRRLQLDRETVRRLTPETLESVAGGTTGTDPDSFIYSCNPALHSRPRTACLSETDFTGC